MADPVKQLVDPRQNTRDKQTEIMEKQEKRDGDVQQAGVEGQKVSDPVTGEQMTIKNAQDTPDEVKPGENVLKIPFPPPDLVSQREYLFGLFSTTISRMTIAFAVVPILAFSLSPPAFTSRPLFLLLPSLGIPAALSFLWMYRMQSKSEDDTDRRIWEVERKRGLEAGYDKNNDGKIEVEERIKESAEWLNALLAGVWPIINPDMFTSTVDMLEDIMQSSVPTFIHSVRIPTLGLGNNPLRITAMRALPDAELDSVTKSLNDEEREVIRGEHVNYELSFAYRAAPNKSRWSEKAENFHLLVEFYLGIKGVAAVPIPVWAEITGIVGTARMRLELIPNPPFLKHTLITLVGLPKVSISITPLHKKLLPNMMDIPFISRFISQSIDAAAKEYVAPKSMMLDLQQMLSGDGISRDTAHIGVVVVHVHHVSINKDAGTSSSDADIYVNVCLSPTNKTQYSTRVISGTLEPVFEETAVLLVDANAAKVGEKVTLQLWDNDRFTADDMIGHVEIDVTDLMTNHNTTARKSMTMRKPLSDKQAGTMEFTVGYFSKVAPGSKNSATDISQDILDSDKYKKYRKTTLTDMDAAVAITPPPEDFLSGILGVQLHEIRELGVKQDSMHKGNKGSSEQPEGEKEIQNDDGLPSSYCTVMLNDEPIYRTRTKTMTATPFFNASTERFVKDWKAAHICIVVRDSRMRENDPIMGMVFFKLSDLFKDGSMNTGSWSLQHGIGFGRIHLSFVFRPVQLTMPPSLIGFELGTIEIQAVNVKYRDPSLADKTQVRIATSHGTAKVKSSMPGLKENSEDDDDEVDSGQFIQLPIITRYHAALVLKARQKGLLKKSTIAVGTIWLRDLIDNHKDGIVRATLWKGSNFHSIKQNYSKPEENVRGEESSENIGHVELKVVFKPGIADVHEAGLRENPKTQRSWEEYVIMKREGLRKNIGREAVALHLVDIDHNGTAEKVEREEPKADMPSASHASVNEKVEEWAEKQDRASADHRGIKQAKGVRTMEWMATGLENAALEVKGRFEKKDPVSTMEKEA